MALWTDSHNTVVRNAVVTSYARLAPRDIGCSLDTVIISLRTSGGQFSSLQAIMTNRADLGGITSKLSAEVTEIPSVAVTLDQSSVTVLSVRTEEALF